MLEQAGRPKLRLIQSSPAEELTWSWFCGQCAAAPDHRSVSPLARTCRSCGTGLLMEARSDAVPASGDAFLVVDSDLRVSAVSRAAELLLGRRRDDVVGEPVAVLLALADAEARTPGEFVNRLYAVSTQSDELHSLVVRPVGAFGVRMAARIAACGPPRAALLVLRGGTPRGGLHVVA